MTPAVRKPLDGLEMMAKQLQRIHQEQMSVHRSMVHLTRLYTSTEQSSLKPNYLKMPEKALREKLIAFGLPTATFVEKCDNEEKLDYLRYYLHLASQTLCVQYQEDLWKHYSLMAIIVYTRHMSLTKEFVQQNHLNPYMRTICRALHKRPKLIRTQLNDRRERWHQSSQNYHLMQIDFDRQSFERSMYSFVEKELHRLRTFYAWKKQFFEAQMNDYDLVHSFYEHQPSPYQVRSILDHRHSVHLPL